ncbi:MAG: hypothetical protein IJO57_01810 [Bacilli bacterium]|nr:hypothetical protein [Bacilli bacterium]
MYNSQRELFMSLKYVFDVKRRINNYYKYDISDNDIWRFLSKKWCNDVNLSLFDIVNDIINLDINLMKRKMNNYE